MIFQENSLKTSKFGNVRHLDKIAVLWGTFPRSCIFIFKNAYWISGSVAVELGICSEGSPNSIKTFRKKRKFRNFQNFTKKFHYLVGCSNELFTFKTVVFLNILLACLIGFSVFEEYIAMLTFIKNSFNCQTTAKRFFSFGVTLRLLSDVLLQLTFKKPTV